MATAGLVPRLPQWGLGVGSEPFLRASHGPPPQPARGAGGRARRPGLCGLRPRSTGPPHDAAQARVRSASRVSGASLAGGVHIMFPLGFKRTPGGGTSPDRCAGVRAGTHDPRPSRPGEGLPGRCLRAWRGVCALLAPEPRRLLQSSREKRRSAAARGGGGGGGGRRRPLVEQALPEPPPPAPTLRVHWDSARRITSQHPGTLHGVCPWPASLPGGSTSGSSFPDAKNPQPLFQLCANHIRLWVGDLNQGILSPA